VRDTPYGSTRASTAPWPTARRFTGQREEAGVGLYDYNARMYSPLLARFLSPDTLVPRPDDPQSFNRYSYVRNNPLTRVDPTGHIDIPWDRIGEAIERATDDLSDCFTRGILSCLGAPPIAMPATYAMAALTTNAAEEVVWSQTPGAVMAKGKGQNDDDKNKGSGGQGGGGGGAPSGGSDPNLTNKRSRDSKSFSRFVSEGELRAIDETGLLRGGREGDTFFTTSKYRIAENAQSKLALPSKPEYRVDFRMTNSPRINGPRVVEPKFTNYKGYPNKGGGIEYWTPDKVRVKVYRVTKLE